MTRHLHETANAVLYRALDLPAGDRQQFIAQATAGDLALFEDVRTMLSRIEQLDQFLEDPLELPQEAKPAPPVLPRHGDQIGRWRVDHELGRNGSDLILLVRGDDGAGATMRLAQSASRTGQTAARFERLRQRLATLEHPALPRPIDGGSSADGRPFFVVERRAGVPLDRYCAEQLLDLGQRAALFARFCDAVHYMHQHLIVHRDLKPADMLVAADGSVTLLEVGMIGEGWPLNPAYASPDQLDGQPLSVSADIYSLGAVLYGLVSGRHAHRVDAGGVFHSGARASVLPPSDAVQDALEQQHAVQADMPDDPAIAPSAVLIATLRLHFDAILVRALATDPAARYPSAHALARELDAVAARLRDAGAGAGTEGFDDGDVDARIDARMGGEGAAVDVVDDGAAQASAAAYSTEAVADAGAAELAHAQAAHADGAVDEASLLAASRAAPEFAPLAPQPVLATPRSPLALAILMLVIGFGAGVLATPSLQQKGLLKAIGLSPAGRAPVAAALAGKGAAAAAPGAALPASYADALALADSRRAAGDYQGAGQAAQQAVALAATQPLATRDAAATAHARLGVILAEQGRSADALSALRKALSLQQSHALMDKGDSTAALAAAGVQRALAVVLAAGGNDAGAEAELASARSVYQAQLAAAPGDNNLRAGLIEIELARATAQNAQRHGRDTVATLAALRRLAGAGGDPRIELLQAYVQPRGTPAQAFAAAQPAYQRLARQTADARSSARAATMVGEIGLRAHQTGAACHYLDTATQHYQALQSAKQFNALDRSAQQRLDSLKQACR